MQHRLFAPRVLSPLLVPGAVKSALGARAADIVFEGDGTLSYAVSSGRAGLAERTPRVGVGGQGAGVVHVLPRL